MTLESLENAFKDRTSAIAKVNFGKPHLMREVFKNTKKNRTKVHLKRVKNLRPTKSQKGMDRGNGRAFISGVLARFWHGALRARILVPDAAVS